VPSDRPWTHGHRDGASVSSRAARQLCRGRQVDQSSSTEQPCAVCHAGIESLGSRAWQDRGRVMAGKLGVGGLRGSAVGWREHVDALVLLQLDTHPRHAGVVEEPGGKCEESQKKSRRKEVGALYEIRRDRERDSVTDGHRRRSRSHASREADAHRLLGVDAINSTQLNPTLTARSARGSGGTAARASTGTADLLGTDAREGAQEVEQRDDAPSAAAGSAKWSTDRRRRRQELTNARGAPAKPILIIVLQRARSQRRSQRKRVETRAF
jgi:hypothetical protein